MEGPNIATTPLSAVCHLVFPNSCEKLVAIFHV